jgi:nitrogen fixation protein FixH
MLISQENSQALKNPWVLGLIAFLLVFLTANVIFIYLAFKTAPSLVVDDFYERGEAYEETLKKIEREKSLGWSGVLIVPPHSRVNETSTYEAIIQGKNSASLQLDSVIFFAYRPSDASADFSVPMEKSAVGSYTADASFNLPGTWDIIIEAKRGEDKFLVTRRIRIDP